MKKLLLATLISALTGFILGWLIYGMLLMDFYESNITNYEGLMKDPPAIWVYAVSNIVMGLLLSIIYHKWAGIKNFSSGLLAGAIIGFLVVFQFDVVIWGNMNLFSTTGVIVDVISATFIYAIMGGVVGFMLGMGKNNE
jgi:uncharacterized membrane protein